MSSIKSEAERCLKCQNPSCSANCPVHTPIPEVMNCFLRGEIDDAGRILFENNPLTAITSIVCPHSSNCYGHCILGKKGEPVEFYRIEQFISDYYLETINIPKIEKNGRKIAVIGSGPSGLSAAIKMALHGYDVTIFEAEGSIGGVLRYGIPGFRLSKDLLLSYRKILDEIGVKLRFNITFGSDITSDDMFNDGYEAVFLGIGVSHPNRLGIPGETFGNVHYAIDYLKSPMQTLLGKKVVIIGAGNVAIDAARTAVRSNHSNVVILNRDTIDDINVNSSELELALLEGVKIKDNTQVIKILDDKVICVPIYKSTSEDGKFIYREDSSNQFEIPADSVIIAIGQGPRAELTYGPLDLTNRGLIETDEFGETSKKGVWASGDIVTGASTVVEAVAGALRTTDNMIKNLESTSIK